jgi:ribosomal protein S18 acetylase RimI-like enzyme
MYREVEASDEDAIFKLGEEEFTWVFERLQWNRELVRSFIETFSRFSFVYVEDGAVKAFSLSMAAEGGFGYICWGAVLKDARRKGVSQVLLEYTIKAMRAAGCKSIGSHVRADGRADVAVSKAGFNDLNQTKKEMFLIL